MLYECYISWTELHWRHGILWLECICSSAEVSFLWSGAATRPSFGNCHILVPLLNFPDSIIMNKVNLWFFLNIQKPVFCYCKRNLTDTKAHQMKGSNAFLCQSDLVVEGGVTLSVHHSSQHCYKMHPKGNFRTGKFVLAHSSRTQSTLEEKLWQSLRRLEDWCSAGFVFVHSGTSVHEAVSHIQRSPPQLTSPTSVTVAGSKSLLLWRL